MTATDKTETPPCTESYDHPAEGWLVSPGGHRVRPMCSRHANERILALSRSGWNWWFEPATPAEAQEHARNGR